MIEKLLLFSQIAAFSNVLSEYSSEEKCKGGKTIKRKSPCLKIDMFVRSILK